MTRCLALNDAAGTLKGLAKTLRVMGGTSGVLYVISLTAAAGKVFPDTSSSDIIQHYVEDPPGPNLMQKLAIILKM